MTTTTVGKTASKNQIALHLQRAQMPICPLEIAGTGSYCPPHILYSGDIDRLLRKPQGWIERSTGVHSRHVAQTETTVDMSVEASRRALAAAQLPPESIDCILFAGAVPHQAVPATAVMVHRGLGLERTGIPAFDVNATCLGFLAALDLAGALITAKRYTTILVCASDIPTRNTSWDAPEIKAIFGDGAAAAVVRRTKDEMTGILAFDMATFSEGANACQMRALGCNLNPHVDLAGFFEGLRFEMDGRIAYEVASKYMPSFVERLLSKAGVTLAEIDVIVPHQASAYALKRMSRRLRLPLGKLIDIFASHGNQVSASLPTALHAALASGAGRRGALALLLGTGAGITLGGAVMRF